MSAGGFSTDGARLLVAGGFSAEGLSVRALDQLVAVPLSGTTGAQSPFVSADSRWIGFFTRAVGSSTAELKKVSMTGGPPIVLCRIEGDLVGASWGIDDTIVFATTDRTTGLLRVPAGGGDPTLLTERDAKTEVDHVLPFVLPGGRAVLFTIVPHGQVVDSSQIAVLDFTTGERKILIRGGSHAEYVGPSPDSGQAGFLVYAAAGTLRAVRFDPGRLVVLSGPVPVVEQVMTETNGTAEFSVSRTGVLAYAQGGVVDSASQRTLVWVDRQGREEPIDAPPLAYVIPRISPDGTRVALDVRGQNSDIWTWDLARKTMTRLTFDPAVDLQPVWTPDSRRILFSSTRNGPPNVYWHAADGTGGDQRLTTSARGQYPSSVTPDGTQVLGHESSGGSAFDIVQMALSAASSPSPSTVLVQTAFMEFDTQLSPDGRHFAYQSNESGRPEIYVRPYPKVNDGRWQISNGGGTRPAWARNGREVFYIDAGGTLTTVPVQASGATFTAGTPATVFATKYETLVNVRNYDVSADGRRFLMIKADPRLSDRADRSNVVVVLNWLAELNARVPVAK